MPGCDLRRPDNASESHGTNEIPSFFKRSVCNQGPLQIASDPDHSGPYHLQNIPIRHRDAGRLGVFACREQPEPAPPAFHAADQTASVQIDRIVTPGALSRRAAAILRQRRQQSDVLGLKQAPLVPIVGQAYRQRPDNPCQLRP